MRIAENIESIRERIARACERTGRDPVSVRLVGVTKGMAPEAVSAAIAAGLTEFGENFVQEAEARIAAVREPARWHFIGHLQRNKVPMALRLFDILESVDSLRLAEQLSRRATASLPVLLEVNVAEEASKFGFAPLEVPQAVSAVSHLPNIELVGLMTVAPASRDVEATRLVFAELRSLAQAHGLSELSMGMTDDFETAIEEGATIIRIGRAIFGERGT